MDSKGGKVEEPLIQVLKIREEDGWNPPNRL